jgi:hypothetical protein
MLVERKAISGDFEEILELIRMEKLKLKLEMVDGGMKENRVGFSAKS